MRVRIISFTGKGAALGRTLREALSRQGVQAGHWPGRRFSAPGEESCASLADWTREAFAAAECLVFIGACGIAVRAIAPYVRDKRQDPAVVVLDDGGRFAIALLSGHVGGANAWAERIAGLTGALPVVTTATDGAGAFAVDLFCKERGLRLTDWSLAKRVSAAVLAGEPVGCASDFAVEGALPRGLAAGQASLGIAVTIRRDWQPYPETLALVPPVLALGIGCRRGVDARAIAQAAAHALQSAGLREEAVFAVGTIDRKSDEPGLAEFCRQRGLPMRAFSAQQLAGAPGTVSRSEFVQSVVGVDNVCERAAVLAAEGRLVLPKQKEGPVTVAAALREWRVRFGDQHAGD